jgi:hypothetical protein
MSPFLLSLALGCAHTSGKNMIEFTPTQSLCLDAVVANMMSNGCKELYISLDSNHPSAKSIQCIKSIGQINEWTVGKFFIFRGEAGLRTSDESLIPVCSDHNAIVFYQAE